MSPVRQMGLLNVKFMWLFCFFDLPTKTKTDRGAATRFRNFLLKDGYNMLQLSVYVRIVREKQGADKHLERIRRNLPPKGNIRALLVTEKQYGRMKTMLGTKKLHEKSGGEQLILL